jgi:hypothetical protein
MVLLKALREECASFLAFGRISLLESASLLARLLNDSASFRRTAQPFLPSFSDFYGHFGRLLAELAFWS